MTLQEIKKFLNENELPATINFGVAATCSDVKKMVDSHIKFLESVNKNPNKRNKSTFLPYYQRLMRVVAVVKNGAYRK
jgi:hypothetical protein